MNRKIPLYSLITVFVVACVVIYSFNQKVNNMQSKFDDLFRKSLYNSMSGFGNDYSQISDENQRIFYYIETASDLKAAMDLVFSTSYNEKNKYLYPSIYYLYTCMTNSSTRRLLISERENIYVSV